MKSSEIRELSLEDLRARIEEQSDALNKMVRNNVISPLENPLAIRSTRRTVARLKTELNARLKAQA